MSEMLPNITLPFDDLHYEIDYIVETTEALKRKALVSVIAEHLELDWKYANRQIKSFNPDNTGPQTLFVLTLPTTVSVSMKMVDTDLNAVAKRSFEFANNLLDATGFRSVTPDLAPLLAPPIYDDPELDDSVVDTLASTETLALRAVHRVVIWSVKKTPSGHCAR